jgi:hypothetical protein
MRARDVRASIAALVAWLACGCYASHARTSDAEALDAAAHCSFSFSGADGARRTCVIEHEGAACTDAARCVCLARLDAPSEAAIDECIRTERMPRALVTLSDVCDRDLPLDEALSAYFRAEGPLESTPRCAELDARF